MRLTVLSLFFFTALSSFAADSLSTKITHNYDSMRALGMGNAFTAVADDYSLIYYNPAGFATKKYNEVQITLVGAGVSPKTTKLVDDIKKASDTQGTDPQKAEAISNVLEDYYGKSLGGKVQALEMFWVRKNWGVALIPVDLTVDMSIDRQLGPAVDLNVKGDTKVAFGYGQEIAKHLSAGITVNAIHRVAVEQSVSALELASNSDILSSKRFKEGNLVDFDLGFMWSPAWFGQTIVKEEKPDGLKVESKLPPAVDEKKSADDKKSVDEKKDEKREPQSELAAAEKEIADGDKDKASDKKGDAKAADGKTADGKADEKSSDKVAEKSVAKPAAKPVVKETRLDNLPLTLGLVVHNVLGGNFTQSKMVNKDATDVPTKMYRVADIGTQYLISQLGDLAIRSMIDFRDLGHPELTFNKSFHAGLEFDYSPSGWFKTQLRGGINQMYYTAGATLLLGILDIDFVTYGEEVGTPSTKLENRVYAAKVGFNF